MRLTKHRHEILHTLSKSRDALSAATLHQALPHINLVTIYRALEYLVAAGAVKKFTLVQQETLYEVQHEPHHHAVCDECGKVIHFTTDTHSLEKEFHVPGFTVRELEVTLRGRCRIHSHK